MLGGYNTDPTKTHVVMMAPLNIPKYAPWNNSKRSNEYATLKNNKGSVARFSKVPVINGPGKLSPFTLKIEVSVVFHLT